MSEFILRQFMHYRGSVLHNNGDGTSIDLLNQMVKELEPEDGELINVEITRTHNTVFKDLATLKHPR